VNSEVVFAAAYAVVMIGAAFGIDRVGRAGARRRLSSNRAEPGVTVDVPWPEAGSMALHLVIAAVAVVASLGLVAVTLIRHHTGGDAAALAIPAALGLVTLRGLMTRRAGIGGDAG